MRNQDVRQQLFGETTDRNLDIGSVFSLGAGLTQMFQKLALRHGFAEAAG